jgi:hypothetical protein
MANPQHKITRIQTSRNLGQLGTWKLPLTGCTEQYDLLCPTPLTICFFHDPEELSSFRTFHELTGPCPLKTLKPSALCREARRYFGITIPTLKLRQHLPYRGKRLQAVACIQGQTSTRSASGVRFRSLQWLEKDLVFILVRCSWLVLTQLQACRHSRTT